MLRESPAESGEFDPASKWVGTIPHVAEPPPGLHEAFYGEGLGGIDALPIGGDMPIARGDTLTSNQPTD